MELLNLEIQSLERFCVFRTYQTGRVRNPPEMSVSLSNGIAVKNYEKEIFYKRFVGIHEFQVPCKNLITMLGRPDCVRAIRIAIEVAVRVYKWNVPDHGPFPDDYGEVFKDGPIHLLIKAIFADFISQKKCVRFNAISHSIPTSSCGGSSSDGGGGGRAENMIDMSLLLPIIPVGVNHDDPERLFSKTQMAHQWAYQYRPFTTKIPLFQKKLTPYTVTAIKDHRLLDSGLLDRYPWLSAFAEDLIIHGYKILRNEDVPTDLSPVDEDQSALPLVLEKLTNPLYPPINEIEKRELAEDKQLWTTHYLSLQTSLATPENHISDVINALIMTSDFYPRSGIYKAADYVTAATDTAPLFDEKGNIKEGSKPPQPPFPQPEDDKLLSQNTRKRARIASLLASSHEIHMQQQQMTDVYRSPRSNVKESCGDESGTLPMSLQEKRQKDSDVANRIASLFSAHSSTSQLSTSSDPPQSSSHCEDMGPSTGPRNVRSARLEQTDALGIDGTRGSSGSGLPSNDLQDFIQTLVKDKITKRMKRSRTGGVWTHKAIPQGGHLLHGSAVTAVGIIVEELATDMMETWREKIKARFESKLRETGVASRGSVECDEDVVCGPFATASSRDVTDEEKEEIYRAAALQVRGMDVGDVGKSPAEERSYTDLPLNTLRNRMEVLCGVTLSEGEHTERLQRILEDERDRQIANKEEKRSQILKCKKLCQPVRKKVVRQPVNHSKSQGD